MKHYRIPIMYMYCKNDSNIAETFKEYYEFDAENIKDAILRTTSYICLRNRWGDAYGVIDEHEIEEDGKIILPLYEMIFKEV